MKKKLAILMIFLLLLLNVFNIVKICNASETPEEDWNKTFDGGGIDYGNCVQQTNDGGYILVGEKNYQHDPPSSHDISDIWLIKTDSNGNKEWDKTFGKSFAEFAMSVQQTNDGGYILSGRFRNNTAGLGGFWIIKTDSKGEIEWEKSFGGVYYALGCSIQETTDGGFITFGVAQFPPDQYSGGWLIKMDNQGNKEWDKKFGLTLQSFFDVREFCEVKQSTDNGYVLAFWKNIIKTDSNGDIEWEKEFADYDFASVLQTNDEGFAATGYKDTSMVILKMDSLGNKEWEKNFGEDHSSSYGRSIQQTNDNGYIIAGSFLIKTDSEGNQEWKQILGGNSVQQSSDGGFIIVGSIKNNNNNYDDIWLIKVKGDEVTMPLDDDSDDILCDKALYVWGGAWDILQSNDTIDKFVDFCKKPLNNFNLVFFFVDEDIIKLDILQDFLAATYENDILVHAMSNGSGWQQQWSSYAPDTYNDDLYLGWLDEIIQYNTDNHYDFMGVHIDLEVGELTNWNDNTKNSIMVNYLELLDRMKHNASGNNLLFSVDLDWTYDNSDMSFDYNGVSKRLSYHTMDIVDFITIMDYTKEEGLAISQISGEMEYANDNNKDVMVAFETDEVIDHSERTFYGEDVNSLNNLIDTVKLEYPEVKGFAIHMYRSYKELSIEVDDNNNGPNPTIDTPGFEIMLCIIAMGIIFFLKQQRKTF